VATSYIAFYNKDPHGIGQFTKCLWFKYSGNPFVVLGGAASVGQTGVCYLIYLYINFLDNERYAGIQFAKLSGFNPIIVTASLKNADYLESLGATHVLDRSLSILELKSEMNKFTSQPIKYVYDTISSPETQNIGIELLASGGHLMIFMPKSVKSDNKHVNYSSAARQLEFYSGMFVLLYTRLTELVENEYIEVCQ
jgi:hypothetical protein